MIPAVEDGVVQIYLREKCLNRRLRLARRKAKEGGQSMEVQPYIGHCAETINGQIRRLQGDGKWRSERRPAKKGSFCENNKSNLSLIL